MILQKYESYKDSGAEWLGEIPEGWKVKRLKDFSAIITGNSLNEQAKFFYEQDIPDFFNYISTKNIDLTFSTIEYNTGIKIPKSDKSFKIAKKNSSLICLEGGSAGNKIAILNEDVCFVNKLASIKVNTKNDDIFLYYLLKSIIFRNQFFSNLNGMIGGVSQTSMKNFILVLPDINIQRKISIYLENNLNKISKTIKILQDKIYNYEELKKSLIEKSVLKGLKDDFELKESGFDWIGQIPKHWSFKRNKNLFYESKALSLTGEEDLLSVSEYTGVTIKGKDLETGENSSRADSLEGYKICNKGDLVINIMLAWKTGLGVSKYDGIVSPAYCVYSPKSQVYPFYFHYLFRTDIYTAEFRRHSTGIISSRLRLYSDKFFSIHTVLPPKEEQIAIANYLDEKTTKIDIIISRIKDQVETLKEFRKTLINDVVTGRIRVQDE
jgi:type I restriction enzyme, S subunit